MTSLCLILCLLATPDSDVYRNNIVVVVDSSGSMNDPMTGTRTSRMAIAKTAMKSVLSHVGSDTNIGIVTFHDNVKRWTYPIGVKNDAQINAAIDAMHAAGRTPLGAYIKIGADALLKEREKQMGYGSYRLLVVTDGFADDAALVEKYVPDVLARGITLDVIGVDMQQDHTLASKASSYRRGNNPDELERSIKEVFAEISSTDGSDIDESFELIEPINEELASKIIKAFASSGNHPIGEEPPKKVAQVDGQHVTGISLPGLLTFASVSLVVIIASGMGRVIVNRRRNEYRRW